jgi:hypothetical protein
MGIYINPEDGTSYTAQCQVAFQEYVENKYYAKHERVPINKAESIQCSNLVPSSNSSASGQSCFDPCDLSSNDQEYLIPNYITETTPR